MPETRKCTACGTELAGEALGGLCPACLIQAGHETHLRSGARTPPAGTTVGATASHGPPSSAPTAADLGVHFPQLEILEMVGQGGMGIVYKARQLHLDRLVALKILPAEVSSDLAFAERFAREARAMARLNHPNIVAVHDFGRAGGYYYLLMEFVDGANLRQLEQSRRVTPAEALALVPTICEALQYAHQEGVVHRDIKPGNILIDKKGRLKIADFGLAKLLDRTRADPTLTASQQVLGTPHYMAPEQMERPQEVDHRADIYSLGVVFYEMLTGELPLGRFQPPSQKVEIDVRLDEVVLKSMAREPERCYQTVGAVKTAVEAIGSQPSEPAPTPAAGVAGAVRAFLVTLLVTPTFRLATRPALVAAGLTLGIVLAWTGMLQIRLARSSAQIRSAEAQWEGMAKVDATIKTNLAILTDAQRKLSALERLSTNRFLWSETLAALKTCAIPNIQVTDISAVFSFECQIPDQVRQ